MAVQHSKSGKMIAIYGIVLLLISSSHHGLSVAGFSTVAVTCFSNNKNRLRQQPEMVVGRRTMRIAPCPGYSSRTPLSKFPTSHFKLLRESAQATAEQSMETSPNTADPTDNDSPCPTHIGQPKQPRWLWQSVWWSRTRATIRRIAAMLLSLLRRRLGRRQWTKEETTLDVSTRESTRHHPQSTLDLEPTSETTLVYGGTSNWTATAAAAAALDSSALQQHALPAVVEDRRALAAPTVNLSGHWTLLVTNDFLVQYDAYLQGLGQPYLVRSLAKSLVQQTTEETMQDGRNLTIRTRNARGVWERTLISSGMDDITIMDGKLLPSSSLPFVPLVTPVVTADQECVACEAWWEERGTVHVSWLRGITKYSGGGDFESRRHVETVSNLNHGNVNDTVYVCRSTFHPSNPARAAAQITWRFVQV
jgi:hypothetical protein